MPKSAIINIAREGMLEKVPFKKLLLFFDNLYFNQFALTISEWDIRDSKILTLEDKNSLLEELEWLKEQKLIHTYELSRNNLRDTPVGYELGEDIKELNKDIQAHLIPMTSEEVNKPVESGKLQFAGVLAASNELIFKMEDMGLRIDSICLGLTKPLTHFVPILNSFDSYRNKQSSESVLHFVLGKIPIPDSNTSWEQILDFRNDEIVQRKYYALLNWINEVSQENLPLSHLADKYNTLYHEYLHQYSLHKLATRYTNLELLILNGIDIASTIFQQNFTVALKGLLNIRKEQVGLLQAEKNIQGREIGYIFTANEAFKAS